MTYLGAKHSTTVERRGIKRHWANAGNLEVAWKRIRSDQRGVDALQVYAYWDSSDHSRIADFKREWLSAFPEFRILGDADVESMISELFPEHLQKYQRISLAACKSDLARLLILHCLGGMYVDCRCGIRDRDGVVKLYSLLHDFEIILYDKDRSKAPRQERELYLVSGVMAARRSSAIVLRLLEESFKNLHAQWLNEQRASGGHMPYHVGTLTGPEVLWSTLCAPPPDRCLYPIALKPEYKDKAYVIPERLAPIQIHKFRSYYPAGGHWSQRQYSQTLFR